MSGTSVLPSPRCDSTPKLPRAARWESFSRLLGADLFGGDDKSSHRKHRRRTVAAELPAIRVSPPAESQPVEQVDETSYLSSLPFSPGKLASVSPKYLSPSYRQPTPTKSPLYVPIPQKVFLGRGSYGNVTLCTYKGKDFALKVSRASKRVGERLLIGLCHPHLVRVLHVSEVLQDRVFVSLEFAGHCNLQQILDTQSELQFPRRLSFCIQVTSGLRHCHLNRIVHCDVKPSNVIVNPHGICKLGDFGHSLSMGDTEVDISPTEMLGTASYAAPEVLRGQRPDAMSDVYSLGVLLWQVDTRETPFLGDHPHVVIYKVANYGIKPIFPASEDTNQKIFSSITEGCWNEAKLRPTSTQALDRLRLLKIRIKDSDSRKILNQT